MMKKFVCALVICTATAVLTGCSTRVMLPSERAAAETHQFDKNYILGQKKTVTVGEPMIKVRDYWIEQSLARVAVPDRGVTAKWGSLEAFVERGKEYPVRGLVRLDDNEYTLIGVPFGTMSSESSLALTFVLNADGTPTNMLGFIRGAEFQKNMYAPMYSDPAVKFTLQPSTKIKANKGYENYELLYTGKNSSGLNMTYREFSSEGMARVAFFQNLTYEAAASSISFKKFRIQVHSATSSEITFTVLEDGYKNP